MEFCKNPANVRKTHGANTADRKNRRKYVSMLACFFRRVWAVINLNRIPYTVVAGADWLSTEAEIDPVYFLNSSTGQLAFAQ